MIATTCATTAYVPRRDDAGRLEVTISLELQKGLAAEEADRRIAAATRAGDIGARVLAFYLLDLSERGAHQGLGFHSIEQYAQTRYHIEPRTTREYLAVGRALDELPAIDEAFCNGLLLWSAVRQLVRVATPQTEDAWIRWARGRTAKEIAAHVRHRRQGELPTDPTRRRIHATRFNIQASLDVVQWQLWNNARQKLSAESGAPVSDSEMMVRAAAMLLATQADGSLPGRAPVNDGHYRVVIHHHPETGLTEVQTDEGLVELEPATARAVLCEAGERELADAVEALDKEDDNHGPPVAPELRDRPTPPDLRDQVLHRDGFCCRCCGSRKNLAVHHKLWRRYGGRTRLKNLLTLCEDCHSLVHDHLLVIRGAVNGRLRFTDGDGRDLHDLGDPVGPVGFGARAPTSGSAGANGLPDKVAGPVGARAPNAGGLRDVIGQGRTVTNLRRSVDAAQRLGESVPHILLTGPAGLGKTTIARAVAAEIGTRFHAASAPVIGDPETLLRLLATVKRHDVMFLDEVHRLPARAAEALYQTMDTESFTLIGATTDDDLILPALRSRFSIKEHLEFYRPEEIASLLQAAAAWARVELDPDAAALVAAASRDTPREALAIFRGVRDEAVVNGVAVIDREIALRALESLGIDRQGLRPLDRRCLETLRRAGRAMGAATLAARLGVSRRALVRVHEPYLVRRGLVGITPHGRVLTSGRR